MSNSMNPVNLELEMLMAVIVLVPFPIQCENLARTLIL